MDRDEAAETLREIEGMRKRTLAAAKTLSPFPFYVWGAAMAAAAPLTLLPGRVTPNVVIGVALLAAFAATDLYRRRMPVHASRPKLAERSTLDIVMLVVLIVIAGPFLFGVFFMFLSFAAGSVGIFVLVSFTSIFAGRMVNNDAFSIAGGFSMFMIAVGIVVSERIYDEFLLDDHPWEAYTALGYAVFFLAIGAVVHRAERRRRQAHDRPLPGLSLDPISPTEPQA